ncbi:MAG: DUF167 domain-containing protein [bacterium]
MLIRVKAFPEAKKEQLVEKTKNSFEIKVKEKAERGEANKRIIAVLAAYLNVSASKIRLIKGAKQSSKIFEIHGY